MGQPVRNIIKEMHPEINEKITYTLLVDGTNLLRICFKDESVNTDGVHYGGVFQFLLQLKILLQKKDFDYVYVFFDNEDSGILRYRIYNQYKANRDKNYMEHDGELSDYMKAYNENLRAMQNAIFNKKKPKSERKISDQEKFVKENFGRERDILMRYFNELYISSIVGSKSYLIGSQLFLAYFLSTISTYTDAEVKLSPIPSSPI